MQPQREKYGGIREEGGFCRGSSAGLAGAQPEAAY